jgi:hypothetical protein
MKRSLLLDADVIIDLYSLNLIDALARSYDLKATSTVFYIEAEYYLRGGIRHQIMPTGRITLTDSFNPGYLNTVREAAKQAQLALDDGELESIAYLLFDDGGIKFCTCDKAAIRLSAFMGLEQRLISLQEAFRQRGGHRLCGLLPRHTERAFQAEIKQGKALRVRHMTLR